MKKKTGVDLKKLGGTRVDFKKAWDKHRRTKAHKAVVKFLRWLDLFEKRSRRSRLTVRYAR